MASRLEIYYTALRLARITVRHLSYDVRSGLYDQSVAEQHIEHWSGCVYRTQQVTLVESNTLGQYAAPPDIERVEQITWSPDATSRGYYHVDLWTPQRFRAWITSQTQPFAVPVLPPTQAGELVAMVEFGLINVWPALGTGVLNVTYKPLLTPYLPGDPLWAAFGADPEAQMAVTGLVDTKMGLAIDGIANYMAAQMLRNLPDGEERFARKIHDHERKFETSVNAVARASIGSVNTTPQRLQPMGGVR